MSKQSEITDRLMARYDRPSARPTEEATNVGTATLVADNGTPLTAKRNRSGVCDNPNVHLAHDECPGRRRAAKIERPVDSAVRAELERVLHRFGGHWMQADKAILGILSPDETETYGLELEPYDDGIPFVQEGKLISFFTSV